MTSFEIWALALGLAMDCFAVSITGGIILKQNKWGVIIKNAFMFGLFQAMMPVIGWACASWFSHQIKEYDHWIAFALLAFLDYTCYGCGNKHRCPCSGYFFCLPL